MVRYRLLSHRVYTGITHRLPALHGCGFLVLLPTSQTSHHAVYSNAGDRPQTGPMVLVFLRCFIYQGLHGGGVSPLLHLPGATWWWCFSVASYSRGYMVVVFLRCFIIIPGATWWWCFSVASYTRGYMVVVFLRCFIIIPGATWWWCFSVASHTRGYMVVVFLCCFIYQGLHGGGVSPLFHVSGATWWWCFSVASHTRGYMVVVFLCCFMSQQDASI